MPAGRTIVVVLVGLSALGRARAAGAEEAAARSGAVGIGAQITFLGLAGASARVHFGDLALHAIAGSAILADTPAGGNDGGFALASEGRVEYTFARHGAASIALGAGGGWAMHTVDASLYSLFFDAVLVVDYLVTENLGIDLEIGFGLLFDGPAGSALTGAADQRREILLGMRFPLTLGFHWYFG